MKAVGLLLALACTITFATRDNLVRHLAVGTHVKPALAAASTLLAGGVVTTSYLALRRAPLRVGAALPYVTPGLAFGLSYVCLFEAYYRGRVSVVSPLVATESLWGVGLSALFLHAELVGRRLAAGAVLVVAGAALIGAFR